MDFMAEHLPAVAELDATPPRWIQSLGPLRKAPSGRYLCRWCGTETKPPRQTWCSATCVEEWRIRSSAGSVRAALLRRDHGICALCGLDAVALEKRVQLVAIEQCPERGRVSYQRFVRAVNLDAAGVMRTIPTARTVWEADHIVPVVEGGGQCGLDGYRTLCCWCHLRETAALAARLAAARRPQTSLVFVEAAR